MLVMTIPLKKKIEQNNKLYLNIQPPVQVNEMWQIETGALLQHSQLTLAIRIDLFQLLGNLGAEADHDERVEKVVLTGVHFRSLLKQMT
jgi:hypothetical protein